MVRVQLRAVRVDLQSNTPVLLLEEEEGQGRTLPIFIGTPEATSIAYATQGVDVPRPLTHDLVVDIIDALGAELDFVVVTEIEGATSTESIPSSCTARTMKGKTDEVNRSPPVMPLAATAPP